MSYSKESSFRISIFRNSLLMREAVVDVIEERLRRRLSLANPKPFGLATGRTMEPIYKALVCRLQSWTSQDLLRLREGWCSFNLDEYVGLGSPDNSSFAGFVERYLGRPLALDSGKIRHPNGLAVDPYDEAFAYTKQLEENGGISFQLLGLGENGHIGFNEPPCGRESSCRVVSLSLATKLQNSFAFAGDVEKVPSQAITLGVKEILEAEEIHLIVNGESKSLILKKLIETSISEILPASWLRLHKRVFIWADEAASRYL